MADEKDETKDEKTGDVDESVKSAKDILESKKKDEDEEDKVEDKDDEDTDDDKDDEEDEEFDKTSLMQAKNLYRSLRDPSKAIDTLKTLVRAAGLDVKEATREEKKEVEKTIKAVVKAKLGTKYPTLSEDLGDMLEEILDFAMENKIKPIKESQEAERQRVLAEKIETAEATVKGEFVTIPDKVLKEADRILGSKEMMPGANTNPEKFFRALIHLAAANTDVVLQKKSASNGNTKKQDDDDVFSKLHSSRAGRKDGVKDVQVKTLDDAVELAKSQLAAKMKK